MPQNAPEWIWSVWTVFIIIGAASTFGNLLLKVLKYCFESKRNMTGKDKDSEIRKDEMLYEKILHSFDFDKIPDTIRLELIKMLRIKKFRPKGTKTH